MNRQRKIDKPMALFISRGSTSSGPPPPDP